MEDPDDVQVCGKGNVRTYCIPTSIKPARHILYRNNGNLTFTEVTEAAGVARTDGRGFGVVAADFNGDGRIDLYVANDMCPNFVFLNRGDGTFEDVTESSGAGYDAHGKTHAGMGVDAEDVDGDGRPDLFVTNYWNEPNSLYMNLGDGMFEDRTPTSGMSTDSTPWVGWGCALTDLDNDGWPDCFVSNGHVDNNLDLLGTTAHMPSLPCCIEISKDEGFGWRRAMPARISTRSRRTRGGRRRPGRRRRYRYRRQSQGRGAGAAAQRHHTGHHWIRLSLVGTLSNRDAVGARVKVELNSRTLVRQRKGGASLESSHDPRLLIGLGQETRLARVTVRWPSGRVTVAEHLVADQSYQVLEARDTTHQDAPDAFRIIGGQSCAVPADRSAR